MSRPVRLTKTLAAASANNIAAGQTPLAAGNLTLNGSAAAGSPAIATLDTPRQVLFTFAANESARTFVVYGFDKVEGGAQIQETVAGAAATAVTTLGFGQITRISVDAATAGALTVGTNGVGWTSWQLIDWNLTPTELSIACDILSGAVNFTVQYTYDDILGSYTPNWANGYPTKIFDDPIVAAASADAVALVNFQAVAWRVQINSGTGTLGITGVQAGVGGIGS